MVQRLYLVVTPRSEVTEVESPKGFSSCQEVPKGIPWKLTQRNSDEAN
jgi:hypothetical protein